MIQLAFYLQKVVTLEIPSKRIVRTHKKNVKYLKLKFSNEKDSYLFQHGTLTLFLTLIGGERKYKSDLSFS